MMNIRIMGSPDLVKAWKAALESEYGISGAVYPNRGRGGDVRAYFNLDDRLAARIVGLPISTDVEAVRDVPVRTSTRKRTPRLKE